MLTINKIVYNPPATIVFWNDGTKTVSKCECGDVYTKEIGFMLCVLKKKYGNKTLHDLLEKYVYVLDEPSNGNPVVWERCRVKQKDKPIVKIIFGDNEAQMKEDEDYDTLISELLDLIWR